MKDIIVIVGPTGVGKTKLSIELAKKLNAEIVNADSMQVYRGLDIGTAKVSEEEKEGIVHHLFDIKNIEQDYSVYDYQKDCKRVIDDILSRKKRVILVGGTGLYIKSVLYDYNFVEYGNKNTFDELSNEELYQKLLKYDKDIVIDKNNRRRLINWLNKYSNVLLSDEKKAIRSYDFICIGLTTDRQVLYDKINTRVDEMMRKGLLAEVQCFYNRNLLVKPLINGIGYKELYSYLNGKISKDEAVNLIKRNTRRYAKRQYTWFKHQMDVTWFNVDFDNFVNTINEVIKFLEDEID
ncbi:MAG: tRNA (adenosine(37)-N6)-dimethylallyltransferase MiaA [bacterium]|nr:tRNA (adenosine(37)-N6)-dimethylallyltransferase MiaA [bacterium]